MLHNYSVNSFPKKKKRRRKPNKPSLFLFKLRNAPWNQLKSRVTDIRAMDYKGNYNKPIENCHKFSQWI